MQGMYWTVDCIFSIFFIDLDILLTIEVIVFSLYWQHLSKSSNMVLYQSILHAYNLRLELWTQAS